jgi:hypothetical protein
LERRHRPRNPQEASHELERSVLLESGFAPVRSAQKWLSAVVLGPNGGSWIETAGLFAGCAVFYRWNLEFHGGYRQFNFKAP